MPFILAVVLAGSVAYQSTTTRGYVAGLDDRPVAGADVLLADSSRIVAHARTNAEGYFRFVHAPHDRTTYRLLICAPRHSASHSSPTTTAFRSTYGLNPVEEGFFWTVDRIGWDFPAPPSCPGGGSRWGASGPFSSFTSFDQRGPMGPLGEAFDSLVFVFLIVLLYAVPLLFIAWLIRTFSHIRRDQVRMLEVVSSIEVELRRRDSGDR